MKTPLRCMSFWLTIFSLLLPEVFQYTIGISMATNCTPLLANIFLYSNEAEFIQSLLSIGKKHLASWFNLTFRYIDDVLSLNNQEFLNYMGQMYPAELEITNITERKVNGIGIVNSKHPLR